MLKIIEQTAQTVRETLLCLYGENLTGHCIEASELICELLLVKGIRHATMIEGWCLYENDENCTDRCYDEHTWVEVDDIYVDVTADQFNPCMFHKLSSVIVGSRPDCMVYERPSYEWLEEKGENSFSASCSRRR